MEITLAFKKHPFQKVSFGEDNWEKEKLGIVSKWNKICDKREISMVCYLIKVILNTEHVCNMDNITAMGRPLKGNMW